MTTYFAAGARESGLIDCLQNEIIFLRALVDRLTQRLGAESQPASEPPATAELSTNPDKLDGYATGYVDGLAAHETAVTATVIPFPRRGDEDITEIVSRLNRRLTGQPESS